MKNALIATIVATATLGLATPAVANDAPEFWAKDVALTLVNNTDATLYEYGYGKSNYEAIAPGAKFTIEADSNTPSVRLYSQPQTGAGLFVEAIVFNPEMGKPYVVSTIASGGSSVKGEETQSVGERERIAELGGVEVEAERHEDADFAKQYTVYVNKTSAAKLTVDNTASTRNTYLRVDGSVTAVRKGEKAAAGTLERKPSTIIVQSGDRTTEIQVSWSRNIATFTTATGAAATLFEGDSARLGSVTVTRADTDGAATTGFTISPR